MRFWHVRYQAGRPFRFVGGILARVFTVYRVAFLLAVVALLIWHQARVPINAILPNVVTDLLAVALTVFIIDNMYRLRADKEVKKVLISKLGSKNATVATEALQELGARGGLSDGSLKKGFLLSANLDGNSFTGADMRQVVLSSASLRDTTWFETDLTGAFLDHADLRNASLSMYSDGYFVEADLSGADLAGAQLAGADVRHEQLRRARSLWRATMPDGEPYDGRYNLQSDVGLFLKYAHNAANPLEWAQFYGVTPERYLEGQLWARENPGLSNPTASA